MNDYLQYWEIFTTVDNFGIGDFGDLAELVLLSQKEGLSWNFKIPWGQYIKNSDCESNSLKYN